MSPATQDALQPRLDDASLMACHAVPGCDAATISVVSEAGAVTQGGTDAHASRLGSLQHTGAAGPCHRVLHGGVAVRVDDYASEQRWPAAAREALRAGFRSSLCIPLGDGDRLLGSLCMYARRARAFDEESERVGVVLARQVARDISDVRSLGRAGVANVVQQRISQTLQRDLSPVVRVRTGLTSAARYLAAEQGAVVGGDWYDVFPLQGEAVGVAVGDVVGHDIAAAATMGQVRSVLRSYAYEGSSPSDVLDRLDRLVQAFDLGLATVVYGTLLLDRGGACFVYANAGHLPPLVRDAGGAVRMLEGGSSWLIGLPSPQLGRRTHSAVWLPSGSTLVLYTDGLVERHRRHLDEGIDRLAAALSGPLPDSHPEALCDRVLERMPLDGRTDDLALLALRVD